MSDIILEGLRAVVIGSILLFFWQMGRKEGLARQKGFQYLIIGLCFIFFGSLIDTTDTSPGLNNYIILGTTVYQSIVEKLAYLVGLVLMIIGFRNWMPYIPALMQAEEYQKQQNERLEQIVRERTTELLETNQQLQREIEERRQAQEQALTASQLKSQILANISHDLRTPLNAIMGYAEMLQEGIYGSLTATQQNTTTKIVDSTGHLLDMVNNLLDQVEIESKTVTLRKSPFKPGELIDVTLLTLAPRAEAKGLRLITRIDPDLPETLEGDPYALRRIMTNLVANAIKFTDRGEVTISIFQPDADHWALQVADTGCGIPEAALTYIFEPFRRLDGARIDGSGAGLGLSIVKQLTALMAGEVVTESQPGQGTTFTIRLPLIRVKEPTL